MPKRKPVPKNKNQFRIIREKLRLSQTAVSQLTGIPRSRVCSLDSTKKEEYTKQHLYLYTLLLFLDENNLLLQWIDRAKE